MPPPSPDRSLRIIRALAGTADDVAPRVIRAYHGSPYSFPRFDASKIGTGEGAQAYGHGLYFAGNEGVARTYRDITPSFLPPEAEALNQQIKELIQQQSDLFGELQMAADADNPFVVGRRDINDQPSTVRARVAPQLAAVRQQIADAQGRMQNVLRNRRGHMYEVEIGYPEQALLDYNRPFSTPAGVAGAEVLRQDNPAAVSERALRAIQDGSWRMESFAGRSPYEIAAVELTRLAKTRRGAQALTEAGIPGIRYLDQGSRAAGEGTRNYVMFPGTEDRIRILRQYGLLPPLVAAGAMQEE